MSIFDEAILAERVQEKFDQCTLFAAQHNKTECGKAWAEIRLLLSKSQSEIEKTAGIKQALQSRWERGEILPSPRKLQEAAKALTKILGKEIIIKSQTETNNVKPVIQGNAFDAVLDAAENMAPSDVIKITQGDGDKEPQITPMLVRSMTFRQIAAFMEVAQKLDLKNVTMSAATNGEGLVIKRLKPELP